MGEYSKIRGGDILSLVPDPHETELPSNTCEEDETSMASFEDVEEILRLDLGTEAGVSRTKAFESFLDSIVSEGPTKSPRKPSRKKKPKFPGVTETPTITKTFTESVHELSSLLGKLSDSGKIDFEFEHLMKDKSTSNKKVKARWSPLHFAAQKGSATLCKAFIEKGAVVDAREDDEWTPLMIAAQNGHLDACLALLDHGANIDAIGNRGVTALRQAATNSRVEVIELLLSKGVDPDYADPERLWTPLHLTCQHDKEKTLETVQMFLAAGANVNSATKEGATPVYLAVQGGRADVVELLCQAGADVNYVNEQDVTPLERSIADGNLDLINVLLENGAMVHRVDKRGLGMAHVAAMQENVAVLERILDAGVNVELTTTDGRGLRPIHMASQRDNEEIALTLLRYGAKP